MTTPRQPNLWGLSIGLVAVTRLILSFWGWLVYLDRRTEATRLAENKIWEIEDAAAKTGSVPVESGPHPTWIVQGAPT